MVPSDNAKFFDTWSLRLTVRTMSFQVRNAGSIPAGIILKYLENIV